jgi:flagellar motor protein MotB
VLRLQELQGKVEDLEQRVAFEVGEKETLAARLQKAQEESATCRPEAEAERRRAAGLEERLRRCEEAEGGLRADQDLGRRARAAVEQERDEQRRQAQAASGEHATQVAALRREIEDCRGRLADAEAQASLLLAEKRKGELVARETVEEVTGNYDRLLQESRASADSLRQKVAELEAALEAEKARIEGGDQEARARLETLEAAARSAEADRARSQEERARLREALAVALGEGKGGGFALVLEEGRAAVTAPIADLFVPRGLELRPGAREVLKRVSQVARQAELAAAVEARAGAVPGDLAKKFSTPWALAAAYAAKVAETLEREGGLAPGRLSVSGLRPAPIQGTDAAPPPAVTIELRPLSALPGTRAPDPGVE